MAQVDGSQIDAGRDELPAPAGREGPAEVPPEAALSC